MTTTLFAPEVHEALAAAPGRAGHPAVLLIVVLLVVIVVVVILLVRRRRRNQRNRDE